MVEAGAVAFSDDGLPVANPALMRRALEYAQPSSTSRHPALRGPGSSRRRRRHARGGVVDPTRPAGLAGSRRGHHGRSAMFCWPSMRAAATTSPTCRRRAALELVRQGKRARDRGHLRGHAASPAADATSASRPTATRPNAKMNPPLRAESDRQALLDGARRRHRRRHRDRPRPASS